MTLAFSGYFHCYFWPAVKQTMSHNSTSLVGNLPRVVIHPKLVNSLMPNGFFYRHSSDRSIFIMRGVWLVFIITMFYRNSYTKTANSVDSDQTPRSVASDLGLHCLPLSIL